MCFHLHLLWIDNNSLPHVQWKWLLDCLQDPGDVGIFWQPTGRSPPLSGFVRWFTGIWSAFISTSTTDTAKCSIRPTILFFACFFSGLENPYVCTYDMVVKFLHHCIPLYPLRKLIRQSPWREIRISGHLHNVTQPLWAPSSPCPRLQTFPISLEKHLKKAEKKIFWGSTYGDFS